MPCARQRVVAGGGPCGCAPDDVLGAVSRQRVRTTTPASQRRTFNASGLTMLVGVPLMKLTTLSNAAPKYIS